MPVIFTLILSAFVWFSQPALAQSLDQQEEERVRQLVRETLLDNPEILMEAMQILQARQQEAQQLRQQSALDSVKDSFAKGPLTPIGGNPEGDVVLVEFFDYQCGYCKRVFPSVQEALKKDGNVKMIFKEFAILGPESVVAARAALAAHKQDRYLDMHNALMGAHGRLSEKKIMGIAKDVGLDVDQLKADMNSPEVTAELANTRQLAEELQLTGTPGFIIGNKIFPGAIPTERIMKAIEKARSAG